MVINDKVHGRIEQRVATIENLIKKMGSEHITKSKT